MDPAPRRDVELQEVAVTELAAGRVDALLEDGRQSGDRVPDAEHDHHEPGEVRPTDRPAAPVGVQGPPLSRNAPRRPVSGRAETSGYQSRDERANPSVRGSRHAPRDLASIVRTGRSTVDDGPLHADLRRSGRADGGPFDGRARAAGDAAGALLRPRLRLRVHAGDPADDARS